MGRKKKNARSAAHGRKIHVNKYINQRGKTKKRAVASCQPAPNRVLLQEMPLTRWPVPKIPKQYEIWFAELGNHYGTSVQSGTRPVLVISNDMANRNSPIITVIPMSSKLKKLELPVHIPVTGRDCEMLRDEELEESILLVEQITTIDKMVLCNRLCRVTSARKKQEIEEELAGNGRIILRESGTEPVIRVMAEADSDELCRKYVREMVEVINSIL